MRIAKHPGCSRVLALLIVTLAWPLTGCSNVDRAVATSPVPDDYHLRHPVALSNVRQTLDIFLDGRANRLDERQKRDVEAFAIDYRANGSGLIQAQVPQGAVDPVAVDATLTAIRRTLAATGVKGAIQVGSYRAADPGTAAVIRLGFVKLQARLASHCGDWPDDLASAGTLNGWENRSYYNFGCSTQQTLAAQVDDPRDLVRPRVEDPGDVQMRTRAIGDIRQGTDPGTQWRVGNTTISSVGAN